MRYLRPVRIDEGKPSKRTKLLRAKQTASLKARGHLDSTGPHEMGIAANNARRLGDTAKFKKLRELARAKKASMQTPLAKASQESFIPLTLPNLMEINIVKGSDGKPVVASGKGTRLKNIGQPTEAALKRRRAGTQNARSERLLRGVQASNRRTALIKRGRHKEATQVPSPPVSTDGIGDNRPGGDAESGEAIRRGIASRGHTR